MTRRLVAAAGTLWLAVYVIGALVPVGMDGLLPFWCPRGWFCPLIQDQTLRDFVFPQYLTQLDYELLVGFGVVSALALLLALRRDWMGSVGLVLLVTCCAFIWSSAVGFPVAFNAIHSPGDFGFRLSLLVIAELVTPILVALAVLADGVCRIPKLKPLLRQSASVALV